MTIEIDLKDQVAIVTGATGALGSAVVKALADAGAQPAGLDLSLERGLGYVDVTDSGSVIDAFKRVREVLGTPTILVNCVGINRNAMLVNLTDDQIAAVIAVNQIGVMNCVRTAAQLMTDDGKAGSIISISSIAREGNPGQSVYVGTKSAVAAMTTSWAFEMARDNIRVNAVAPGPMDPKDGGMMTEVEERFQKMFLERTPTRHFVTAQEIANAVLLLLSPLASGITGETITVSNGLHFGNS